MPAAVLVVVLVLPKEGNSFSFAALTNLSASLAASPTSSSCLPITLPTTPLPSIKYCPISSGTACSAAVPTALPVSISTGRPSAISASA